MWEQFKFYVRHSFNDLRVNGRRTFFALLCIAAGVAAIVSLQTLAVMAGDSLVGAVQETNRADIRLQPVSEVTISSEERNPTATTPIEQTRGILADKSEAFMGVTIPERVFTEQGLKDLRAWIDAKFPGELEGMTSRQFVVGVFGLTVSLPEKGNQASFIAPFVVDTQTYPLYGKVTAEDGRPLKALFKEPTDIVISHTLANKLDAAIGDTLRLNKSNAEYKVTAIVPDQAEGGMQDMAAGLFGYVYLDTSALASFEDTTPAADNIYWRLKHPERVTEISQAFRQEFPFLGIVTTDELKAENQQAAVVLNQLVTVMGLISLLIGGIGIINTMQVVVRRRTVEVAVLKTIGLEANQVTVLFLVEAFLMGVIGSLMGIVAGWGLTFLIKGVAETFLAQSLAFRIAPEPALTGLLIGTLVTTIFGFLPTLSAGQVRPGLVLRPNDSVVPRAGCLRTLGALLVVITALSLVTQSIVGNLGTAVAIIIGAFVAAGVLYVLLWALIWVVGRLFPSFGFVDLKVALRAMLAARRRGATTLLALVIGVFSLSLITLFATAINNLFESMLVQQAGGNVFVFAANGGTLPQIEDALKQLNGVKNFSVSAAYNAEPISVLKPDGTRQTFEQLQQRVPFEGRTAFNGRTLSSSFSTIAASRVDLKLPERKIVAGRQLDISDAGKQVLVIPSDAGTQAAGLGVGDKIVFQIQSGGLLGSLAPKQEVTFEIVGMFERATFSMSMGTNPNASYAPYDSFPANLAPTQVSFVVNIDEKQIGALQRAMGKIPGTFALETKWLNQVMTTLIGQFTSFPIMVAVLGLLVGGIVIANSVALTTMERRREIAIMKAVGLQRERVLGMLLLENALMGLIGGLIGVGIGLVALMLLQGNMQAAAGNAIQLNFVPYGPAFILMGLCILVALLAALATAWGASGEKPLNVLRYE